MSEIKLRTQDLVIGTYKDRETGEDRPIIRLANHLAFDETFQQEMEAAGVKRLVARDSSGEAEEEAEE